VLSFRLVAWSFSFFTGQSLRPPTLVSLGRLGFGAWSVVVPLYARCSRLRPGHDSCATDLQCFAGVVLDYPCCQAILTECCCQGCLTSFESVMRTEMSPSAN